MSFRLTASSEAYDVFNTLMDYLVAMKNTHVHYSTHGVHVIGIHCDGVVEHGTGRPCGSKYKHMTQEPIRDVLDDIAYFMETLGPPPNQHAN